jgi:WD40 repeat protein
MADRDLLVLAVALQMQFLTRQTLRTAVQLWAADPSHSLSQILLTHHLLTPQRLRLLEEFAGRQLRAHTDDPQECLSAMDVPAALLEEVQQFAAMAEPSRVVTASRSAAPPKQPWFPKLRSWLWCHRAFVLPAGAIAAIGLVLVFFAIVQEREPAELAARQQAERQAFDALRSSRENLLGPYAAAVGKAQQAWDQADLDGMVKALQPYGAHPGEDDPRGFEWHYLWHLAHSAWGTWHHHHGGQVWSLSFSPDGRYLLSTGADGLAQLWEASSGQLVKTVDRSLAPTSNASFSPDGRFVISVSPQRTVHRTELATGRVHAFPIAGNGSRIHCVVEGAEGWRVAAWPSNGKLRIWDATTGAAGKILEEGPAVVRSLAFSPDGRLFASGGNGPVQLWNVTTGDLLGDVPAHTGAVKFVVFSSDGHYLATAGEDRSLRIWRVTNRPGRGLASLAQLNNLVRPLVSVAFSMDGRLLAAADARGLLRVWETTDDWRTMTGPVVTLRAHAGAALVQFSPDGRWLVSAGADGQIKTWADQNDQEYRVFSDHTSPVRSMAIHPDGRQLASCGADGQLVLWDALTGQEVRTLHDGSPTPTPSGTRMGAFGPSLRKGESGQCGPSPLSFSPDGRFLAAGSDEEVVRIWETASGTELPSLPCQQGPVTTIAFSPDGRLLASGGRNPAIRLWDMATARELRSFVLRDQVITCLAFSPDGEHLAGGCGDAVVRVWQVATGRQVEALGGHQGLISGLAFSPDGHYLATSGFGGTIQLWPTAVFHILAGASPNFIEKRASSAPSLLVFRSHGSVNAMAFSADGKRLVTANESGGVTFWDSLTGQEIFKLKTDGSVHALALGCGGRRLAAGTTSGTIRVWDLGPQIGEEEVDRQAFDLIAALFRTQRSPDLVYARIRDDKTLPDGVRQRALAGLGAYWRQLEWQDILHQMDTRFAETKLGSEVITWLQSRTNLPETVRQRALEFAGRYQARADDLNNTSWFTVRQPNREPAEYELARRQIAEACSRGQENGFYLNTLGVAQYRLGHYDQALKTLTRSDQINTAQQGRSLVADVAFLAMAEYQLGHVAKAHKQHARLQQAMERMTPGEDIEEARAFLREVDALVTAPAPAGR